MVKVFREVCKWNLVINKLNHILGTCIILALINIEEKKKKENRWMVVELDAFLCGLNVKTLIQRQGQLREKISWSLVTNLQDHVTTKNEYENSSLSLSPSWDLGAQQEHFLSIFLQQDFCFFAY